MQIIDILLSIFLFIGVGFFSEKKKLLGKDALVALNKFVYYFGLPALVFSSLSQQNFSQFFNFKFMIVFTIGMIAVFVISKLLYLYVYPQSTKEEVTMKSMLSFLPNTAFMGIPICSVVAGKQGVLAGLMATLLMSIFQIILLPFLKEHESERRHNLGVIVLDIFKQPFSIMILLGLLTSYFKITIPDFILESSTMLGATATPCALFAIGMALGSEKKVIQIQDTFMISLFKFTVQPLIVLIGMILLHVPHDWAISGLILSALPPAASLFIFAKEFKVYAAQSATIIFLTTICSSFIIPIMVLLGNEFILK